MHGKIAVHSLSFSSQKLPQPIKREETTILVSCKYWSDSLQTLCFSHHLVPLTCRPPQTSHLLHLDSDMRFRTLTSTIDTCSLYSKLWPAFWISRHQVCTGWNLQHFIVETGNNLLITVITTISKAMWTTISWNCRFLSEQSLMSAKIQVRMIYFLGFSWQQHENKRYIISVFISMHGVKLFKKLRTTP